MSHSEDIKVTKSTNVTKRTNVILGLTNPKSPTNVGSVMRASGCYGVDSVVYTGERYERAAQFNTDTHRNSHEIPLTRVEDFLEVIPEDATVVCVELVEGAIPLPAYEHPDNAFYIFGPEDGNIQQKIINRVDDVVYVPTVGCMNLAATVNVLLYDRLAKSTNFITDNDLVKDSRDNNNKLRVKAVNRIGRTR